jgi:hypothetical protein
MALLETKKALGRADLFRAYKASIGLAVKDVQGLFVNGFAQCFARLEMWHPFFRNLHTFTGARIAANTGRAAVDGEAAKTTDLNAMAFDQGFAHGVQDRFDGEFGVTVRQLLKASGQSFNEVGTGHVRLEEFD